MPVNPCGKAPNPSDKPARIHSQAITGRQLMIPSYTKYTLPAGLIGAFLVMVGMAVKYDSRQRQEIAREIDAVNAHENEYNERMTIASKRYLKLEDAFYSYFNGDRRELVGTYRDLMARTGIPAVKRYHAVMAHVNREIDSLFGSTLLFDFQELAQFEALVWVAHTAHERAIAGATEHFEYHKNLPEGEICEHTFA